MAGTSKELLDSTPKPSILEKLDLGINDSAPKLQQKKHSSIGIEKGRPFTTKIPKSQILGKLKDFLGVMAEANKKLELDAQRSSRSNYDIEMLDGNEQEHIEMELLLGVADLHNQQAVAAAEATMAGFKVSATSTNSDGSRSDSEDDSDDENDNVATTCHTETSEDHSLHLNKRDDKRNKKPKIVVLN